MDHNKKRISISYKFTVITTIVSIITVVIAYFGLNGYKSSLIKNVYQQTNKKLLNSLDLKIDGKRAVGLTNAFSIANDGQIKQALYLDTRDMAISSLQTINQTMKDNTRFKNIKVHIHTKDNHSFIRNWKLEKYGDDLSSFRTSVVYVNSSKKAANGFEIGKAGLSLRAVVPIMDKGTHLGSLEFIQGLNSVAKAFDKKKEGFLLLMDKKVSKVKQFKQNKIFQNDYIISQKFVNQDFLKDADKDGRSFNAFMKDCSTYASVFGHVWVVISKNSTGAMTRAQEQAMGVRPYVSMLTPLTVLDWNYE